MTREANRAKLIAFLETIRRPERPLDDVGDSTDLAESGLVDSLSLIEIVGFLEATFGVDFSDRGLEPGQLRTIGSILDLIERRST